VGSKVPDYRGLFLRGHGSQTHAQENGTTIGVTSTTHSSGTLGNVQGDTIRNITGYVDTGTGIWSGTSGAFQPQGKADEYTVAGSQRSDFDFDASRVVPVANENRPVNTAVRYLMRALP
jgi:hypothetical protein